MTTRTDWLMRQGVDRIARRYLRGEIDRRAADLLMRARMVPFHVAERVLGRITTAAQTARSAT